MVDDAETPRSPFGRLTLEDLEALSGKAQGLIEAARDAAVEPHKRKLLRRFGATEILQYLGNISIDTLYRRLKKDDHLPQGTQVSARRREFTLAEIHHLQRAFGMLPRRPEGKRPLVLSVCNFKGGVAKTTTTAHLAQYLCLHGYRVLAVDLDAQASLTQTFGIFAAPRGGLDPDRPPLLRRPDRPGWPAQSRVDRHPGDRHSKDPLGPARSDPFEPRPLWRRVLHRRAYPRRGKCPVL